MRFINSKKKCFIAILFFCYYSATSQKIIDHKSYNSWCKIKNEKISSDGTVLHYEISPLKGDSRLIVHFLETSKIDTFNCSKNAVFSEKSNIIAFRKTISYDRLRNLKLKKKEKFKAPKDSLCIYFLKKDSLIFIPELEKYKMSEENNLLGYLYKAKKKTKKKKRFFKRRKKVDTSKKKYGFNLKIIDDQNKIVWEAEQTMIFCFSKKGKYLAYIQKKEKDSLLLNIIDLDQRKATINLNYQKIFALPVWNEDESVVAFKHCNDSIKEEENYLFSTYEFSSKNKRTYGSKDNTIFNNYAISEKEKLTFSSKKKSSVAP